ncbi:MAG: UvrD-helicase domain-containing protein [[Eubacterium] sulci]|nr:UvrD-helicase domain-containing protein [[Eubacterium] sulci]
MDKRIVLATAGSGKTFYIANSFCENSRVLLLSFTNRNVDNIRREIIKRFSEIPADVKIHTFDSFVYNFLIRPFEPILNFDNINSSGVEVKVKPVVDAREYRYVKMEKIEHYMIDNRYYISRISKLFINQDKEYKIKVLRNIEKYFDMIFIDEFQDYNGNDFKVLKYLLENLKMPVIAVGDIFQSNVTPIRDDGVGSSKPFKEIKCQNDLYSVAKIHKSIDIDEVSLKKSRRAPECVCEFIRNNLNINILSCSDVEGNIEYIDNVVRLDEILNNKNVVKLIWNKDVCKGISLHNTINWSYSKGDTYLDACIILTKTTSDIKKWSKLSLSTRNKLYVALTRAKNNVYLIRNEVFESWKNTRGSITCRN